MEKTGCLICGKELIYLNKPKIITCNYCNIEHETITTCIDGHYICDECHSKNANELIQKTCEETAEKDPIKIAIRLMKHPIFTMHGPEHHFLVPAVLITAYYNTINKPYLKKEKLKITRTRSNQILGGFCGSHGSCGAAIGTGIFISIITNATPLSKKEWMLSNQITAKTLEKIARYGGPRCCKRNTLLAIYSAVKFANEKLDTKIKTNGKTICSFNNLNNECIEEKCPFYPKEKK